MACHRRAAPAAALSRSPVVGGEDGPVTAPVAPAR